MIFSMILVHLNLAALSASLTKSTTYIVITLGIPGSGKSTTYNALLDLAKANNDIIVVKESSDDFKVEYLAELAKEKNTTVYELLKVRKGDNRMKEFIFTLFYKRCRETLSKYQIKNKY